MLAGMCAAPRNRVARGPALIRIGGRKRGPAPELRFWGRPLAVSQHSSPGANAFQREAH
jgi:hypothetical protein